MERFQAPEREHRKRYARLASQLAGERANYRLPALSVEH
jgi:hypothetical protein